MTKIRPPAKWIGGKYYLAQQIINLFPEDYESRTYVEPYGGMASVLLQKKVSRSEVYGDINCEVTNLFEVLRNDGDELLKLLRLTPYSEKEFNTSKVVNKDDSKVEAARKFIVRYKQSFAGLGGAFSLSLHRTRNNRMDVVNGWLSNIDENLPKVIERLRQVLILQRNAVEVIMKYDTENLRKSSHNKGVLFYCDPPYLASTKSGSCYKYEMNEVEHKELLEVLKRCKGKVLLSGYRSKLYDSMLKTWNRVDIDIANHVSHNIEKEVLTECVWMNY